MPVIDDLKKTVDATPFFAAVGATDLAVEKMREARLRADKARAVLSADLAPAKVQARATTIADQVKEIPAVVLNETLVIGGKVAEGYDELAVRGHQLVTRLRNQKATQDLVAQAETTVAQAKGAVTTARKAAADVERSAKATLTTGRKEAAKVAAVVTGSVVEETKVATTEVKKSAKATRTAAKRTSTTTKNAAKKTTSSAKAATTSAIKTADAAENATETGRREDRRLTSRPGRRTVDHAVTGSPFPVTPPMTGAGSPGPGRSASGAGCRALALRPPAAAVRRPGGMPVAHHPRIGSPACPTSPHHRPLRTPPSSPTSSAAGSSSRRTARPSPSRHPTGACSTPGVRRTTRSSPARRTSRSSRSRCCAPG